MTPVSEGFFGRRMSSVVGAEVVRCEEWKRPPGILLVVLGGSFG